jgi:hypothetical protein
MLPPLGIFASLAAGLLTAAALLVAATGNPFESGTPTATRIAQPTQSSPPITPGNSPVIQPVPIVEPFRGELNGFRFTTPEDTSVRLLPEPCTRPDWNRDAGSASASEVAGSGLNFSVAYMLTDWRLSSESGLKCSGVVTSVVRNYTQGGAGTYKAEETFFVARIAGEPNVVANAAFEKLTPVTIGGRASVVIEAAAPGGRTVLFMRDDASLWYVAGPARDEVLAIAQGLR